MPKPVPVAEGDELFSESKLDDEQAIPMPHTLVRVPVQNSEDPN
jgi:hypothetical protein